MTANILRRIVRSLWRSRIAQHERIREAWTSDFLLWKSAHPDRCMYCAYTRWAGREQGVKLTLDPHRCVEGNSPPHSLPVAKVIT